MKPRNGYLLPAVLSGGVVFFMQLSLHSGFSSPWEKGVMAGVLEGCWAYFLIVVIFRPRRKV